MAKFLQSQRCLLVVLLAIVTLPHMMVRHKYQGNHGSFSNRSARLAPHIFAACCFWPVCPARSSRTDNWAVSLNPVGKIGDAFSSLRSFWLYPYVAIITNMQAAREKYGISGISAGGQADRAFSGSYLQIVQSLNGNYADGPIKGYAGEKCAPKWLDGSVGVRWLKSSRVLSVRRGGSALCS